MRWVRRVSACFLLSPQDKNTLGRKEAWSADEMSAVTGWLRLLGASDTWPGIASCENSSQKPLASRDGPPDKLHRTEYREPDGLNSCVSPSRCHEHISSSVTRTRPHKGLLKKSK